MVQNEDLKGWGFLELPSESLWFVILVETRVPKIYVSAVWATTGRFLSRPPNTFILCADDVFATQFFVCSWWRPLKHERKIEGHFCCFWKHFLLGRKHTFPDTKLIEQQSWLSNALWFKLYWKGNPQLALILSHKLVANNLYVHTVYLFAPKYR